MTVETILVIVAGLYVFIGAVRATFAIFTATTLGEAEARPIVLIPIILVIVLGWGPIIIIRGLKSLKKKYNKLVG